MGILRRAGFAGTLLCLCWACGSEFDGQSPPSSTSVLPNMAGNGGEAGDGGAVSGESGASGSGGEGDGGHAGSNVIEPEPGAGAGGAPVVDPGCQAMLAGCSCINGKCGPGLGCTFEDVCVAMPAPLAHWPLNENGEDVSGNGYNGVALNGVVFDGSAANFDGVDSYIDISGFHDKFNEIAVDEMTLYIRVKASNWGSAVDGTEPILFGSGEAGENELQNGFWFMVTSSRATIDTETGAGVDNLVLLGDTLTLDTWHDLVFWVNAQYVDLYVNGEWVEYKEFTAITPAAENMQIGGWLTAESVLNGAIDDIQVYDTLLEDPQIEALSSTR